MELIPIHIPFRKVFIGLTCLILVSCAGTKWSVKGDDREQMLADITFLASEKLEGRAFGSKGEMKAGDYIAGRFKLLGLKPMGDNGTYFQTFTVKKSNPHDVEFGDKQDAGSSSGRNVIGYLDQGAANTVIVGAHYDHLGFGGMGSLAPDDHSIHNGADDNASGTAMIMELAQQLKDYKDHNYLFIAFTGEESGLWGSNYFTKHPTIDFSTVAAMVNFDMVGRLHENKIAINGTGTSPAWPGLIKDANVFGFDITMSESGVGPSDHTSFYLMDIPSIHFFTGAHEDYHKPSDDVEKINSEGMVSVADFAFRILRSIGEYGRSKLEFTKTKDADKSGEVKLTVTLGIVPDYLYSETGLRIDGVREDKPAAMAGLKKGDIIVKMGDHEIKDIYSYMESLNAFHKGEQATIVVMREGKEMTFTVQF